MRLFEAIINANHRAIAGDASAGLRPADHAGSLPVVALTCIDPRLNPLIPEVLGVPEEQFIWLRNAGNIITGPSSSTMRSLALACAVKGGHEIAVIGHTDCLISKTPVTTVVDALRALGVERRLLPENVTEYFGIFSSERQNVIHAARIVRSSPLIGPRVPVHGLLLDIGTGQLEWLVNGYEMAGSPVGRWNEFVKSAGQTIDALKSLPDFQIGEIKFPETKIGEIVTHTADFLGEKVEGLRIEPGVPKAHPVPPPVPPKLPQAPPPRLRVPWKPGPKK